MYTLSCDVDSIEISSDATLTRTTDERLSIFEYDDVLLQHIRLFQPGHLLWTRKEYAKSELAAALGFTQEAENGPWDASKLSQFDSSVTDLLRILHLYKPGRLVAGDTSFFIQPADAHCGTLLLTRCSEMSIDYHFVRECRPLYVLDEDEIPFFLVFQLNCLKLFIKTIKYPQIDMALYRYASESSRYGDAVELMISLEALLVPEEEGIAFRLAQRVANLLGADAEARKGLFTQIRDFYSVRSRVVHGAKFRAKDLAISQNIDQFREITRRVLLSVIALAADLDLDNDFYATLNHMCFDDDLRRSLQSKASALLHC